MSDKHLQRFPKPLLQDLLENKWLPIVGAGFSLNALIPNGEQMPLWDELGRKIAAELEDYPYSSALDALSAYSHEFSRVKLIERLRDHLLIGKARPGAAHQAFARLKFDIVCTTNFDFLLEKAYEQNQRYCHPILDEEQLSVASFDSSVRLIKLHGDIHHPQRMVVTEDDYDLFLERYPLVATYLASLMITRTPVFIGYSLDDPDFRMIWRTVSERLGTLRRQAYVILLDAKQSEMARYERRGVKPVNIKGSRTRYGEILAEVFDELGEYVRTKLIPASQITEEEPLQELTLPYDAATRLCFFAVPFSRQAFYRDKVFPLIREYGLVPTTAEDVIAPGDNIVAKIDAMIYRANTVVVDASNKNTLYELRLALSRLKPDKVLVIAEDITSLPADIAKMHIILRTKETFADPEVFLNGIEQWLETATVDIARTIEEEPRRLLNQKEYRAAVIAACTLLETSLRNKLDKEELLGGRVAALMQVVMYAHKRELISSEETGKIKQWVRLRNTIVHTAERVSAAKSRQAVEGVLSIVQKLKS